MDGDRMNDGGGDGLPDDGVMICPIMSGSVIMDKTPVAHLVPCINGKCQWWVNRSDGSGACSVYAAPGEIHQIGEILADKLMEIGFQISAVKCEIRDR